MKQWGPARESLQEALAAFEQLACTACSTAVKFAELFFYEP